MSQVKGKPRSSNLELMRIVLMLLIVVHHAVVNSGVMDGWARDPGTPASFVLALLGMWGKSCINPFVLVTGYFMCGRGLTARKTVKLFLQVVFWFLLVNCFLVAIGQEGVFEAVKSILTPARLVDENFISSYLILYLLIPLLNLFIRAAGKRGVAATLVLLLWTQTILPTFLFSPASFSEVTWYVALYFIGAAVRLWPARWMTDRGKVSLLFVGSLGLSVLSVVVLFWLCSVRELGWSRAYFMVSDSGKVLALSNGLLCFLWFKGLRMRDSRKINVLASTVFGVLLIHANCPAMREWLWSDLLGIPVLYQCRGGGSCSRFFKGGRKLFGGVRRLLASRMASHPFCGASSA